MSMGITNNYSNYAGNMKAANVVSTKKYQNIKEYSKYLTQKYRCLTPGKNVSVSVSPGLMRKAMGDEKVAAWLEKELASTGDMIKVAQKSAIGHGSRLTSVSIEYQEDCTIMKTCGVFGETGTDSEMDKWLEKIKESKEERKQAAKKTEQELQKDANMKVGLEKKYSFTVTGNSIEEIQRSMTKLLDNCINNSDVVGRFDVKV